MQLKFNGKSREGARLNNGELVTVREVRSDGALVVEDAKRNRKTLGPDQRLFGRGYAVTSYGSQGKTVDTVLFADAGTKAATDARQWYVTVSRGRRRVVVFTSDKETKSLRALPCGYAIGKRRGASLILLFRYSRQPCPPPNSYLNARMRS